MTGTRLSLPDVTLLAVDTRTPTLALAAMQACQAQVQFGDAVLFTDPKQLAQAPASVRIEPAHIDSVPAYSRFMLQGLLPHVHTSHLLVVQWDGYLLDAAAWDPAFLDWDYIGAPWHDRPAARAVGNGGFSLRSRRLLQALLDPALVPGHPEDVCICEQHRTALERTHGIRIAPLDVARRFAFERTSPDGPTLGFHGLFNFDRVMPDAELQAFVDALPPGMLRGLDGHDLCTRLIDAGRLDSASRVLHKRLALGMHDRRTWRLRARLWWARRRHRQGATA
ncbi:MAG: DUF5672 family protein [Aquabacterium sp.]